MEELERELGISGSVKLASNENPAGPSPRAVKALIEAFSDMNRYPDGSCYYLRKGLARKLRVRQDCLTFGNGSNEILELAVRTFLLPGDEAVIAHPSFVVYSTIVQAARGKAVIVPLKDMRHDLKAMAARVTKKTKIIFIANPNNPTGTINTAIEFDAFIKKVPDSVLVVVDEAYFEYVTSGNYPDCTQHLRDRGNLLILRTFSKIYGLAALRIGYGISSPEVAGAMNRIRQPFNVNAAAQRAALAALQDKVHVKKSKAINEKGKQYLYKSLETLGINFIPTEANFIFVMFNSDVIPKLHKKLLREGVIIRPMGPSAMRITIGMPSENRRLVSALRKHLD